MNQRITNFATVSIALIALVFSASQLYLQRIQNHVSVEPRLNAYYTNEAKLDNEGFHIVNNGLGPAFVESLDVMVSGKKVDASRKFSEAGRLLGLNTECLSMGEPRPNDSIKTGEEILLLGVPKAGDASKCAKTRLDLFLMKPGSLDFIITVKSIYGDRFKYQFSKNVQESL
ncbi:hypothetical protein PSE10A_54070 [Pseudomonas amygdali pv. eriobotryae]|uniref:Uncharacterized protein n=1 Tax=Pseudomonas amygdali pv. eriobotryae TaxID=129137 RepID=A0A9P3AJG5_PSEA0|nr:hypothetical protein [Pseudomonas amygdali]GFZ62896.1 hypothetical protein PSE10A_54070 [Pseudomonas amygdali pv. eriobotryae]